MDVPGSIVSKTVQQPDRETERKDRVLVDVRGLNKICEDDPYTIQLQSDIISAVQGSRIITVVDIPAFFSGWPAAESDRHCFTVDTHRGQETFLVIVMGLKGSLPFTQRRIDAPLRFFSGFARASVNDVVICDRTFEEPLHDLRPVFGLLNEVGLWLSPKKSFLGYPSVQLFGQHVGSFGLLTNTEKRKAVTRFEFPKTLQEREM